MSLFHEALTNPGLGSFAANVPVHVAWYHVLRVYITAPILDISEHLLPTYEVYDTRKPGTYPVHIVWIPSITSSTAVICDVIYDVSCDRVVVRQSTTSSTAAAYVLRVYFVSSGRMQPPVPADSCDVRAELQIEQARHTG